MKIKHGFIAFLILTTAIFQYGMARNSAQYDEEARAAERAEKEIKKREKESRHVSARKMASGVKESTVDSASSLLSETTEGAMEDGPIVGTLEGARQGTGTVLDKTVKGVSKVATLGYGEVKHYEVEEPEANSNQPTKIKIRIPGT
ncbi:MAG: hypothetical protein HYZ84_01635 [Candidatus Omnitrophica bacterium]|nr:hypothetical protein [Candidatus Omnitrophota bacterium]